MSGITYWAQHCPDKTALVMADTSQTITFSELHTYSELIARWMHHQGLKTGDNIIILLENRPEVVYLAYAAELLGLYYSVLSTTATTKEIQNIIEDNQTKYLFVSPTTYIRIEPLLQASALQPTCVTVEPIENTNIACLEHALTQATQLPPLPPQGTMGRDLLYSSGTTGRAKGIKRPLPASMNHFIAEIQLWRKMFHFDEHCIYLSTAPLYHAAPLRFSLRALHLGATVIILPNFNAELALQMIEKWQVTHSQWVPAMFARLLELDSNVRDKYNLDTMQVAIHAAAPCPIHIKHAMIDWWGPVIYEYYAGSEGVGTTMIQTEEWLRYPGSVGRVASGAVHIVDDKGNELPHSTIGHIYFSGSSAFEYVNDPEKTQSVYNQHGWATYGDIGYVNEEGYLFLSDRRSDLIVSGGVNIYPQEIEDLFIQHPAVADVAVIGVPDEQFGETPKALIMLYPTHQPAESTAKELVAFMVPQLAKLKYPKTLLFVPHLPRTETGKMSRSRLKQEFKAHANSGFVLKDLL